MYLYDIFTNVFYMVVFFHCSQVSVNQMRYKCHAKSDVSAPRLGFGDGSRGALTLGPLEPLSAPAQFLPFQAYIIRNHI